MKQTILSLEFATNMFGNLSPEIKNKLQAVIENPTQNTWEEAHSIILNAKKMTTLWQAIFKIRPNFCQSKPCDAPWPEIPTSKEIVQAIKNVVFVSDTKIN